MRALLRWFALGSASMVLVTWSSVVATADDRADAQRAELCFGQSPTILGTPGEEVVGTEGPDVVVTNGGFGAKTLGGDDLVCVTGVAELPDTQTTDGNFDTGEGNDRLDAAGAQVLYPLNILPGPGQDEVTLGTGTIGDADFCDVSIYAREWSEGTARADADVIRTGAGDDCVYAGVRDLVDLGAGDDTLGLSNNGHLSGGTFDGGTGRNTLAASLWIPFWHPNEHHSWKIDNREGRMTRDGQIVAALSGFLTFDVEVRGPLRFIGSDLPELFYSVGLPPEEPLGWDPRTNWPMRLSMHGGNDVVAYYRGGPDSTFDGGDGTDRFSFIAETEPDKAFLDLETGVLRHRRMGGYEVKTRALHFENVRWFSGADATIRGTNGPNRIVTKLRDPKRDVTIYGEGGDDILRGGQGDDLLVGGRGDDVANGRGGDLDRCEAEVRKHCET